MATVQTDEIWVDIEGYGGVYQVSNLGRVRSHCGPKWGTRSRKPRVLKPGHDGNYLAVNLMFGTGYRRMRIHRLVSAAFIGSCPPGQEVRHLDGNPSNNQASNLAYGTRLMNMQDAIEHGTIRRGEDKSQAKLTDAAVRKIRAIYAAGGRSHRSLAAEFGVTHALIQKVIDRRAWKHIA
jgi:hypothetical protein